MKAINLSRHIFIILLASIWPFFTIQAQTQSFEDFQKQIESEYDSFEKKTQEEFDQFVQQIDAEFADFLAKSFREFESVAGKPKTSGPKPKDTPKFDGSAKVVNQTVEAAPPKQIAPPIRLPNIQKTEPSDFKGEKTSFGFFGAPINLEYDPRLKVQSLQTISPDVISEYWSRLSETYYNHLIKQLEDYRTNLNLNDWGYYQLIQQTAASIQGDDAKLKPLLSWFLLTRARFKTKIAFADDQCYLLLPARQLLYGTNYVQLDNIRYYVPKEAPANFKTYEGDFPEAGIIPDLTIRDALNFPDDIAKRSFSFDLNGKHYNLEIPYNKNVMAFYNNMPLTDPDVYFNSAVSRATKEGFQQAFLPILQKLPKEEAAAFLLKFVQHAFEYQTDQDQFGYERYLFADELLYYAAADCEDRAVLYAWLSRELLGLQVIGLAFEGHMATAICLPDAQGTKFMYKGCDYVVADPTFIDAPIGLMMPLVQGQKPELIEITVAVSPQEKNLRAMLQKGGFYRADRLNDLIIDNDGNAYACGYFIEKASIGSKTVTAGSTFKNSYVASFDRDNQLRWIQTFQGTDDNLAYSLSMRADGDLSVAGTFKKELNLGKGSLEASPGADIFVLRVNKGGQLKWATQAGLFKLNQQANFMFSAAFDATGSKWNARLYSETEDFEDYGLRTDDKGNTFITGSFFATSGMNVESGKGFNSGNAFDPAQSLKSENDALLAELYEKTIAGLFAAMKLMQVNTIELKGEKVKAVFDQYNPTFIKAAPAFYSSFGKMRFMKNAGGIISIRTEGEQAVVFDKIKIEDNAKIKVVTYKSGNARIEVFSGIEITNGKLSYPLNEVKLYKENGDLLLDFDTDNSQIKLNLKKDMLYKQ